MTSIDYSISIGAFCLSVFAVRGAFAEPQLFVYKGAGCTGAAAVPKFEAYLDKQADGVTDFIAYRDWAELEHSARWILGCWKSSGKGLSIAIPMLPKTEGSLAAGAKGEYDKYFSMLGQTLVDLGGKDAYLRIGIEFNGDWFPWSASKDPAAFKTYFVRIVRRLREVENSNFKMVWNPNMGRGKIAPDRVYPGDAFVDVIAMDVYNQSWRSEDRDPIVRWKYMRSQPYGLDWLRKFAAKHRKRIAIPEWGTGSRPDGHGFGDDPMFIEGMIAWMRESDVLFHGYWDYRASDYDAQLSTGRYPASARAFKRALRR